MTNSPRFRHNPIGSFLGFLIDFQTSIARMFAELGERCFVLMVFFFNL